MHIRFFVFFWVIALAMPSASASDNRDPAAGHGRPSAEFDRDGASGNSASLYYNSAPEGLVGNGRSVVKVRPAGFEFFSGGTASGRFRLVIGNETHDFPSTVARSEFFPGGVIYSMNVSGYDVDVLHGALPDVPYLAAIRVKSGSNRADKISIEVESKDTPQLSPAGRTRLDFSNGAGLLIVSAGRPMEKTSWEELRNRIESPYQKGLLLQTPSKKIDRAVRFCQFLLDLGYDGRLMVSELFRWRDIWSRDLGTGLAPGAMIGGRYDAARASIQYDLNRYAAANPRGLRITEDASQGGSAEGTAWLTRAVWRYYQLTGDRAFLASAASTLRPWVDAWIDRDADETGLIVDVTEWMDHSRFLLFPDGSRVLYSNVLMVELLKTFSKIENELGNPDASGRMDQVKARFVRGINTNLWNESAGAYDNLILWGRHDERLSSGENALAVLSGVAPPDRAHRALDAVRKQNWRPAGSVTIFPPMTHVDDRNDQNVRVWPWWNAVEARARFGIGDVEGGVTLLDKCAATLEDEHYPGFVEELLTPEGVSEGGHAFLSAAGTFLDAVYEGLLGVEILEAGCSRIRVVPHVPAWDSWEAVVPLPQGELALSYSGKRLHVRVTDPRVKIIEAPEGAVVEGATRADISKPVAPEIPPSSPPAPVPSPRLRKAALFTEAGVSSTDFPGLPKRRVTADQLMNLNPSDVGALVIAGNALPRRARSGGDVQAALSKYLDAGGAIVFYGATMQDRGTMGEQGGVVEWYEYLPAYKYNPISGWRFHVSADGPSVAREKEQGYVNGWSNPDYNDGDWRPIRVPGWWEDHLGHAWDGWGWYRTAFDLPESARGKTIVLDIGRIDDDDWTYVNGVQIGSDKGWQTHRIYYIKPDSKSYEALKFGAKNILAVQVFDGGGGGGLHADPTRVGYETNDFSWQPINPKTGMVSDKPVRHGVVSWGPGGDFFNSWETSRGVFGFKVAGHGAKFAGGRLADERSSAPVADIQVDVHEAFTDFAVSRPWRFDPLAFTETNRRFLYPDHGERYPCAARVVNTKTGGEFILIPSSLAATPTGSQILKKLKVQVDAKP